MALAKVLLLLGSNLGNSTQTFIQARQQIQENSNILSISSLYETEPWGIKSENAYLNQAVIIETDINPFQLLIVLQEIEIKLGRTRLLQWEDRVIDIDILFYSNFIIDSLELRIPHPRFQDRKFSLIPACEIAADWNHPLYHRDVRELLNLCKDQSLVKKLD